MELLKVSYGIEKLQDIVEERSRLVKALNMSPSINDTISLKKQLNATLDSLKEAESCISDSEEAGFNSLAAKYNSVVAQIPDEAVEKGLYTFSKRVKANKKSSTFSTAESKKVRFKDNLAEFQEHPSVAETQFAPFTDDVQPEDQERDRLFGESSVNEANNQPYSIAPQLSNQDIFIQQQQQLLEQDSHLESLSHSVHRGHELSLDIHHEMTDQNDSVLRDLESLVDSSGRNLDRAKNRLQVYEKTARENGPCLIIVLLVMILVLLLVAL
ncbi:LAME_0B02410g1_1 [Lachancea meyersii CBS 8951]|uniref:LAME_0B02410g1_1 n=1 Tax=Lachancea meyersii CBS 8951 TaxID=1266667 RepID=A0A1G4IUA2_9SACH|nr:LAME_0B02410g1_1 [Lachancea meyersii CBS 8951]